MEINSLEKPKNNSYDKKIITKKLNKDGENLLILRKITSKEIVPGTNRNTARYNIYTKSGENVGYIDVEISNNKMGNRAEIQYESNIENKGNITIALEEVLKDIFINRSFDGLQMKTTFPKTNIKEVFLDISEDNHASQVVAKKNGFVQKQGRNYEITESEFLKKINETDKKEKKYLKRKEIMILLQAIDNCEIQVITPFINDKQLKEKIKKICAEDRFWEEINNIENEYLTNIAKQIREEDYCFLEERINDIASKRLICATGNTKYIKKCVDTLNIDVNEKVFLVGATKEENYIKEFLNKNKDKLEGWQKAKLISDTGNIEYIKQCLYDESLQLDSSLKANIIGSTEDAEYIKEAIEKYDFKPDEVIKLIEKTNDSEYIRDKIENSNFKISNWTIVRILKKLNDKELIKDYIDGNKLELKQKIELIKTINESEYIKQFINENSDFIEKNDLINLTALTNDSKYIYESINDTVLNLQDKEKIKLIIQTKNKQFIEKYEKENKNLDNCDRQILEINLNPDILSYEQKDYKKIELPKGMTIGMEIESEGEYSNSIPSVMLNNRWRCKRENSINNGIEIVSTILNGTEQDSKEIYAICNLLKSIGQTISERCGAHVHIGADFLKNKQAYINLLEIVGNCEEIIYVISNKSNSKIRKAVPDYCFPISTKLEEGLLNGNLDSCEQLNEFIEELQILQKNRFSGINFMNIGTNKNTIEFRMPNGTIEPDVWIENINLFGGIIKSAQELSVIQNKEIHQLTSEEKEKITSFRNIKNYNISQKEKLYALLSLTVKDKNPYIERYDKNIELINYDAKISETMQKARLTKPLDIRKIRNSLFTGEKRVNGADVKKVEDIFNRDIHRTKEGEKSYG